MTYLVMFITLIRSIYLYHSLFFACHIYIYIPLHYFHQYIIMQNSYLCKTHSVTCTFYTAYGLLGSVLYTR